MCSFLHYEVCILSWDQSRFIIIIIITTTTIITIISILIFRFLFLNLLCFLFVFNKTKKLDFAQCFCPLSKHNAVKRINGELLFSFFLFFFPVIFLFIFIFFFNNTSYPCFTKQINSVGLKNKKFVIYSYHVSVFYVEITKENDKK